MINNPKNYGTKSDPTNGVQHKNDSIQMDIIVGANRTAAYMPLLKDKKVAVVGNQSSLIFKDHNENTHLVDSLLSSGVKVVKVFSPEHGFRGDADAGEKVKDGKDAKTGLPIISLYGNNRKPSPEQMQNIDLMIFDIQDVGVRFYTYISTLHYIMEACAEANIPLFVFDRPNPNGSYVDGPTLKQEFSSFIGMHTIPLVHGMTIGEYAKMINGEKWLKNGVQCNLRIIEMENYDHDREYSLPVRPSPNLPNDQSVALYPSLGLFEGTNINAGRGTDFQFQRYGAPFLNKDAFDLSYTPQPNFGSKDPKQKGKLCYGEDLSTIDAPKMVTLRWLIKAYSNCTDKSQFFKSASFTKHSGTDILQKQIESCMTDEEIRATWQNDLEKFRMTRAKYLIYE